jgi:hypothetical protein
MKALENYIDYILLNINLKQVKKFCEFFKITDFNQCK